jgi:hypothetical protein
MLIFWIKDYHHKVCPGQGNKASHSAAYSSNYNIPNRALWQTSFNAFFGMLRASSTTSEKYFLNHIYIVIRKKTPFNNILNDLPKFTSYQKRSFR